MDPIWPPVLNSENFLEHSMFLAALEKWEGLVKASLAKVGWTCHSPYRSPDAEDTSLADTAALALHTGLSAMPALGESGRRRQES